MPVRAQRDLRQLRRAHRWRAPVSPWRSPEQIGPGGGDTNTVENLDATKRSILARPWEPDVILSARSETSATPGEVLSGAVLARDAPRLERTWTDTERSWGFAPTFDR